MDCPTCSKELIWVNDFDYEDYGIEGEGIVRSYSCCDDSCNIQEVIVYGSL